MLTNHRRLVQTIMYIVVAAKSMLSRKLLGLLLQVPYNLNHTTVITRQF